MEIRLVGHGGLDLLSLSSLHFVPIADIASAGHVQRISTQSYGEPLLYYIYQLGGSFGAQKDILHTP